MDFVSVFYICIGKKLSVADSQGGEGEHYLIIPNYMQETGDLFEDMKRKFRCSYISDLPKVKQEVLKELEKMDTGKYPETEIQKLREYLAGK